MGFKIEGIAIRQILQTSSWERMEGVGKDVKAIEPRRPGANSEATRPWRNWEAEQT